MFSELCDQLIQVMSRRGFLQKTAQALAAIGLVLAGVNVAEASVVVKCCLLCRSASVSCSGCVCQWCWTCLHDTDGCTYSCNECYSTSGAWCDNRTSGAGCPRTTVGQTTGSDGEAACNVVTCSSATKILTIPCEPPDPDPGVCRRKPC
jgi:hypothetical protein